MCEVWEVTVIRKFLCLCLLVSTVLTGCTATHPETGAVIFDDSVRTKTTEFLQYELTQGQEIAVFETTLGEIKIALFTNEAPNTVTHFKKLITNGFYTDKAIFLEGDLAVMFSGAVDDDINLGEISTPDGAKVEPEFIEDVYHFYGAVSTWGEVENRFDSRVFSDSRFFIVGDIPYTDDVVSQLDSAGFPYDVIEMYKDKGGLPQFYSKYTVFGQVYEGLDIVEKITSYIDGGSIRILDDVRVISASIGVYEE